MPAVTQPSRQQSPIRRPSVAHPSPSRQPAVCHPSPSRQSAVITQPGQPSPSRHPAVAQPSPSRRPAVTQPSPRRHGSRHPAITHTATPVTGRVSTRNSDINRRCKNHEPSRLTMQAHSAVYRRSSALSYDWLSLLKLCLHSHSNWRRHHPSR